MVKEVGEFSPHTLHLSSMDVNTDLPTPNASSWVGFFRSNAALGSIRIHWESCNAVQLFWWGWSYWSAWIERTQINWQLSFISMTVAGTCYFIAQKKTSILLERMKFTRETTPKKKKKRRWRKMFYTLVIHSETKENESISPTIWIPKY